MYISLGKYHVVLSKIDHPGAHVDNSNETTAINIQKLFIPFIWHNQIILIKLKINNVQGQEYR